MDLFTKLPFDSRQLPAILAATLLAIIVAGVAQDYVETLYRNYDFYWSESHFYPLLVIL